jgi:pimeloyl-ACP methyl ester carboxylesterase
LSHAVLLLHGQPGSARDWEPLVAALGDDVAALAIDRPGWGETDLRVGGRAGGLEHNADAALAALDAAGVERATVVGLSFGGAVASWLALAAPERVGALVLVSPAANLASLEPIDRLLAAPIVGYVASAALLSGAGLALGVGRVRRYLSSAYSLPDDYLRASSSRFRGRSAWNSFVIEQRALLRDLPVLERRLEQVSVPTTVVIGSRDVIVSPDAGRRLREQIPGAVLIEIEGGHHVLPAEHPERVAAVVRAAGVDVGPS